MTRFLASRLLQALVVLLLMSFVITVLMTLMPGDPVDMMLAGNPRATPADAARLKALYGLDKPLLDRYWHWLQAALIGDFGFSRLYAQPVLTILLPRLGNTLLLLGAAMALTLAVALPLGVYAARRPYGWADNAINLFCFAGISVPAFWLALLLILLFAVELQWLPASGLGPVGGEGWWERLPYLVLPVASLTLASIGGYTRYVRAAMMGELRQDYVRTARAKGLGEGRVVWRHALRNATIPIVTIVALEFGALFSGALVTETMFAWPGMGKLIYDSIMGNDLNVALVALLFATLTTLAGNLLADAAYAGLDPRISFKGDGA
ncbi:ABC transporter permease [Azospirillum sp. Vi22]|uniref:ABC transporter permease n=1 Tax=Azospirillum baldaniorum TaxID=1064539 RepID=UPI00157ADD05|nr:ABC transporter permease [Azospirillum baldaniorum]NUB11059.1 ABC transporter permease [Azospirillum baldaniorum]